MFFSISLKMRRKNHFAVPAGPSDGFGVVMVTHADIEHWVNWQRNTFIMDYTGLPDATGDIEVFVMNREALAGALKAYDLYRSISDFPPEYPDQLEEAKRILDGLAPVDLTVEVEHDGEGVVVHTLAVPA